LILLVWVKTQDRFEKRCKVSMRVILQISSGPQQGRKVLLGPHRELRVGRTELAELACEDDIKMSRVHFKLDTNAYGCSVEDLGSSNGTFVNEVQITESTVLREGDRIRAGSTQFRVSIEGGSVQEADTINQVQIAALRELKESKRSAKESAAKEAVLKGEKKLYYRVEQSASGLSICTPSEPAGKLAAAESARVASLLATIAPQYLLVHPLKTPQLKAEAIPEGEPLFDWMPEEVARERSPLLVPAAAAGDLPQLFEQAWGHNAMTVIIATANFADLLDQIRKAIRPPGNAEGMLGLCWPNVLSGLLTGGDGQLFESQLADVQAVLLEDAQRDMAWKLICEEGFVDVLDGIGLEEAAAEKK